MVALRRGQQTDPTFGGTKVAAKPAFRWGFLHGSANLNGRVDIFVIAVIRIAYYSMCPNCRTKLCSFVCVVVAMLLTPEFASR